ncbi:MAG: hypothetical protein ACI8PQ_001990, partial [Planctomycetota bacterium]
RRADIRESIGAHGDTPLTEFGEDPSPSTEISNRSEHK